MRAGANFGGVDGGADGFSVGEAETPVQAGEVGCGGGLDVGLSGHRGEDGMAERFGEGEGAVGEEGEVWSRFFCAGRGAIFTRATSMPSAEVPLMMPATMRGLGAGILEVSLQGGAGRG